MRQIQSVAFRPQQPSQRQHLYTWSTFQDNDGKDNDIDGDNEDHDDDGSGDDGSINDYEMTTSARRATRLGETTRTSAIPPPGFSLSKIYQQVSSSH